VLTSLVLKLAADQPARLPLHLGRASHAAFLRLIARSDPKLAERLHNANEPRCLCPHFSTQERPALVVEHPANRTRSRRSRLYKQRKRVPEM